MIRQHLVIALLCTLVFGIPLFLWERIEFWWLGVDWNIAYYPASTQLLHGLNPYNVQFFQNPIWALLPLLPLSVLGSAMGATVVFFLTVFSFAFVALRLGAKPVTLSLLLLSPFMFYALVYGNIDWLVVWGYLLPPPIGMFFVVLKPQLGMGVMIYWAYEAWKSGRTRQLVRVFAPVGIALLLNLAIFGNWLADRASNTMDAFWNVSAFPWALPLGFSLVGLAIYRANPRLAISASPLLTPYLTFGSWITILMGTLDSLVITSAIFIGSWGLFLSGLVAGMHH